MAEFYDSCNELLLFEVIVDIAYKGAVYLNVIRRIVEQVRGI